MRATHVQGLMKKNLYPLYFVIGAVAIGLVYFVSTFMQDMEKTVPKIKLSYFPTVTDVAQTVLNHLELELRNENQYWIGIEPQKQAHMQFAEELVLLLKSQSKITQVYIDQQLGFKENELATYTKAFPNLKIIPVRENWIELAELYKNDQMNKTAIVTAAIYSTSILIGNPINKIKGEVPGFNPVTFSSGHFAVTMDDEQNNIFPCFTEDKTGANQWACTIINKARTQRRKVQPLEEVNQKKYLGLMDSTGEKDYMILLTERKK